MRTSCRAALLIGLALLSGTAQPQSPQFIGRRVLKRVWFETCVGVSVLRVTSFDSGAAGCTDYSSAVLPTNHPNFKEVYAILLSARALGEPIESFILGCYAGQSGTYPSLWNVGVGSP